MDRMAECANTDRNADHEGERHSIVKPVVTLVGCCKGGDNEEEGSDVGLAEGAWDRNE